ncbi:SDR family NAD(P)-dependent oxidoreductase [Herbaspirillum sp. WKF16]|jgi:NAD(P)-dependent dehydrogenase (short-subunit alcohol dehydrogenase family)|uniref:SDR family NAD(P)-dependent oxidoreductase n=1 Tax=Herbaspirillum sp. WKF16 TaxID=3028312 RepID=UPI0023A932D8|nr:SDR family NAD(P)-dependent oxidoreductase [Herbaspirillum sp. WKF16]WDZ95874.1 SDR family NAD(P)-dependent oxidoreductase [Herbaspirillum sp. WKF16]
MDTWLITNANSSFGLELTAELLARGHAVAATVRSESERRAYELRFAARPLCYVLDVTDSDAVRATVDEIEAVTGGISVVVNNDGGGYRGMIEEVTLHEMRAHFEANVFGAIAVIQAALPYMRQRRAGRIFNILPVACQEEALGAGVYHGSKSALEGMTDALAREVAPFGIHATAVTPGCFADASGRQEIHDGGRARRRIADYHRQMARPAPDSSSLGDPERAAQAVLLVAATRRPPRRLLLGSAALDNVRRKIGDLQEELSDWELVSMNTDLMTRRA